MSGPAPAFVRIAGLGVASGAELLRLRDKREINDRDHQDLRLGLDREHADLTAA